jgi:hypothetical protein
MEQKYQTEHVAVIIQKGMVHHEADKQELFCNLQKGI